MKQYAPIFLLCVIAALLIGHPNTWLFTALKKSDWWLVVIAALTGLAIAYQAREMTRATKEMKRNTRVARDSFEAGINERRARIRIQVSEVVLSPSNPNAGQVAPNMVTVTISNYGQTTAFVDTFGARFIRADIGLEGDFWNCRHYLIDSSLAPNASSPNTWGFYLEPNAGLLSEDDIINIHRGESFLHFYAYVDYRDVYGRSRRQTKHVYWKMQWGGMMQGQIMQWWEAIGPMGDNEDSEYRRKLN